MITQKNISKARAEAREKVAKFHPYMMEKNVICHLDQDSFNNNLCNLAIMSRTSYSKLLALLRWHKIPKGRMSKKFALGLRSKGEIGMIHPIKERKRSCVVGFKF